MVKIEQNQITFADLAQRLQRIERQLTRGEDTFSFFRNALQAHADRIAGKASIPYRLTYEFSRRDDLSPHQLKLLNALTRQFDLPSGQFSEINFSKLCKAARVRKEGAKDQLIALEQKQLVNRRKDGNRLQISISDQCLHELGHGGDT